MNTDQTEIILQYLRIDTNYAVIINGEYGIGKTHFYKNELVPKIRNVSLPKDDNKKFTPIHISLFGFKNLEEIQTAIFIELYPILKSKKLKLAVGIGKSIIRGITQIVQAGDIDAYIGDITQEPNDWLKYDELVICFDDLDRKSQSLDLRDVFGFINSLVENQGVKILIIANEKELIKDPFYSSNLREKVVGISIQFKPNTKTVYNQIIETKYFASSKNYFDFLSNAENEIVRIIETNQNNFRNLIFFLEHFRTIFYPLAKQFQDEEISSIQKEEKLLAVLNFTLAISIEYKLGLLNSTNIEDVEKIGDEPYINLDLFSEKKHDENIEIKMPYVDVFRKKYFSHKKYFFFKSILEYITGAKAFDPILLKKEIENYFILEDGKISEQDILLNKLGYLGCLNLNDKEYRELTLKMLSFLDAGKYQLNQYGTVFHFAIRFNNILNFNFDKLKTRFKAGIKRGKPNYEYNFDLAYYMLRTNNDEFKEDMNEIIQYCLQINDSLIGISHKTKLDDLFKTFQNDYNTFFEKVKNREDSYQYSPFWLEFNFSKIITRINNFNNEQIWMFGHYITSRYRKNIYEKLFPEKAFIIKLREHIDRPTKKRGRKNLRNASLDYLSSCLKESEENFPI